MITSDELKKIQDYFQLKKLKIELRPNWGSETNGHREEIHGALKHHMTHANQLYDASISHTQGMGGFAFIEYDTNDVLQLGFDLERTERISDEIAQRVSSPQECNEAPSSAHLWCCKEAAYKCLKGPQQPNVISAIHLEKWDKLDSQIETCRLQRSSQYGFLNVQGLVFQKKLYTLSIFVARP